MVRPFQKLDQFFDVIETLAGRRLQVPGLYFERLSLWLLWKRKSQPYRPIHHLLERFPGLSHFLVHQGRDIIVYGKSCTHIMMLQGKTS
jgi:hypothetical protein